MADERRNLRFEDQRSHSPGHRKNSHFLAKDPALDRRIHAELTEPCSLIKKYDHPMNKNILTHSKHLLMLTAGLALTIGLPVNADAGADAVTYGTPVVKQMKVKDHKVKVKVVGGKAKIKIKRNGKEKVKIKGRNGQLAAEIAANANEPTPVSTPYYGK